MSAPVSGYFPVQLQNTTRRMTLLQEELEEWQTGKKKSEQIAQLQEEIAAMETALQGMTEVSNPLQETIATVSTYFSKRNHIFRHILIFFEN